MLPSPGFSIPSIDTPLAHAGEDEMILPAAQQQQQQQSVQQHLSQQHMSQQQHMQQHQQSMASFGSGLTPHSLMQPHTPVRKGCDSVTLAVGHYVGKCVHFVQSKRILYIKLQ